MIGYIQSSKEVFAKMLLIWIRNELEWLLVPGRLCISSEFTKEILNSGEERATYEKIGMR